MGVISLGQICYRLGFPADARNTVDHRTRRGREDNNAILVPAAAFAVAGGAERHWGASGDGYLAKLAVCHHEEGDVFAVRRPERVRGVLGAGE